MTIRLDQALVERGLCESREKAKRLILAGQVRINGQVAKKSSDGVRERDELTLEAQEKFVSRGGTKLDHALTEFGLSVEGMEVLDVGASTGGFTDCLLQRGASKVYAIDVGHGQLAWKLRQDPRVVVMEGVNARYLASSHFPSGFQTAPLAVVDCSFISLKKILPGILPWVSEQGKIVALIKPQFEAGKAEVDKGAGVILDPLVHERVIKELESFVLQEMKMTWRSITASPILGPAGNKEFLVLIEKAS